MIAAHSAATSAGPRTPFPSLPNSSGSLSAAAATMIGVAIRKPNLAASWLLSPTSRPPPIVTPEREMPGISASAWEAPTAADWPQVTRWAIRLSSSASLSGASGARLRRRSAPNSSRPLTIRKIAAIVGEANSLRSGLSSVSPRIPAGIVADDEQPAEPGVGVVGAISRSRSERPRPLTIRTQSRQKKPSSTSAVARCTATRNVRKNLSFWWMSQPNTRGSTTAWPRLEIGNSSVTP